MGDCRFCRRGTPQPGKPLPCGKELIEDGPRRTYRARHGRPAPAVSVQVRADKTAARWAAARPAVRPARRTPSGVVAQQNLSATVDRQVSARLERIGTPLLLIRAGALALALIKFCLPLAEASFVGRMFDLRIFRHDPLIVRQGHHLRSGPPTQPFYLV